MPDFLFTAVPNQEAIDFIQSKQVMSRDVFDQLLPELQARAFTISGAVPADVMQTVRDLVAGLPAGQPWDVQKKLIAESISPYFVDPAATEEVQAEQSAAAEAKAELLLRIHGQEAYAAAAYKVMDRQRAVFKNWQYQTMGDARVRPTHAALDGIVLPADSPFWDLHYPPWDWGCRCIVIPLSDSDVADVAKRDADKPVEQRSILEGPLLRELELNNRLVRGMNNITNVAPPQGVNAFRFDPGAAKIDIDYLRAKYSPEVWQQFESWAQKTKLPDGRTVYEWLTDEAAPAAEAAPEIAIPPAPAEADAAAAAIKKQAQEIVDAVAAGELEQEAGVAKLIQLGYTEEEAHKLIDAKGAGT